MQSARALPFVKVGGSVRFTKGDIASYLGEESGPYIGRLLAEEIGGKIETAFLFLRFDAQASDKFIAAWPPDLLGRAAQSTPRSRPAARQWRGA